MTEVSSAPFVFPLYPVIILIATIAIFVIFYSIYSRSLERRKALVITKLKNKIIENMKPAKPLEEYLQVSEPESRQAEKNLGLFLGQSMLKFKLADLEAAWESGDSSNIVTELTNRLQSEPDLWKRALLKGYDIDKMIGIIQSVLLSVIGRKSSVE